MLVSRLSWLSLVFFLLGLGTVPETVYASPCKSLAYRSGYDLYGNDTRAVEMTTVSADKCADLCCNEPGCISYTGAIAPAGFSGCNANKPCCFLKNAIPRFVPSSVSQIASGIIGNCSILEYQDGKDLPGYDMMTVEMPSLDKFECSARCCALSGCHAFTIAVAPSAFLQCGQGSNCCYLKSIASGYSPSSVPRIGSGVIDYKSFLGII